VRHDRHHCRIVPCGPQLLPDPNRLTLTLQKCEKGTDEDTRRFFSVQWTSDNKFKFFDKKDKNFVFSPSDLKRFANLYTFYQKT
jgi:hypothetical protein